MTGATPLDDFLALLVRQHEDAASHRRAGALRRSVGERHLVRDYAAMAETSRSEAAATVGRLRRELRAADERSGGVLPPDRLPGAARALVVHSLGVRDPLLAEADAAYGEIEGARARIPLRWWWRRARGKIAPDDPLIAVEAELERAEAAYAAVWRRWARRDERGEGYPAAT